MSRITRRRTLAAQVVVENMNVSSFAANRVGRQAVFLVGTGLGDGQAGGPVGGDGAPFPRQWPDPPGDGDGLGCVREGQPGRDGGGFDRAGLFAAVPAWRWRYAAGMVRQGRFLICAYKLG